MLVAADSPTGGEPGVRAFVLSNIYLASPGDAGTCPVSSEGDLELFFKMLPAAERAKYAKTGSPKEVDPGPGRLALDRAMVEHFGFRYVALKAATRRAPKARLPPSVREGAVPTPEQVIAIGELNGFPKGRGRLAYSNTLVLYDECTNPEDFPMLGALHRTYDGRVAPGLDLDGKAGKEDFIGLDGTEGVDNQLWRAVGCNKLMREQGEPETARKTIVSATSPTLIELRGVDDVRNDPQVTVTVHAGAEPLSRDGRGQGLAGASFAIDPDPQFRATARGRIVDGVLTTDPFDFRVKYDEQIIHTTRDFRGARIRAELKPDGSIDGGIYGYQTLASHWSWMEQLTHIAAGVTSISCPGVKRTSELLADGYRDKRTGRFTAISSAYNFVGVRAFVIKPRNQVASQ
jgi:hypothetical protein